MIGNYETIRRLTGSATPVGRNLSLDTMRSAPKTSKPALVVNDLDRELSDEVLNQLAIEDALPDKFCQLSLNTISSYDNRNCINSRLKSKIS
jgi:hypothetical protein